MCHILIARQASQHVFQHSALTALKSTAPPPPPPEELVGLSVHFVIMIMYVLVSNIPTQNTLYCRIKTVKSQDSDVMFAMISDCTLFRVNLVKLCTFSIPYCYHLMCCFISEQSGKVNFLWMYIRDASTVWTRSDFLIKLLKAITTALRTQV